MSDWFTKDREDLHEVIAETLKLPIDIVARVYDELIEYGIIDYDKEKDVIYDMFGDEEDE